MASKERADWEMRQAKTFTKWCNMYLRRKNWNPIEEGALHEAFHDGIKLMELMNALYDIKIPKHKKKAKMRPVKMDNVNVAMKMLSKAEVTTYHLKATNLLDGDFKMILGMVWAIILDFNIKGIGDDNTNAKEGLLLCCRKKTKGYPGVDGDIKNFSTSWKDGLAFTALIHRHYPDLIEYDENGDPEELLEKAFACCEENFGIARLLDVEDLMVVKPDEKSVMTYVSEMYKVFSKMDMKEASAQHIKDFLKFIRNLHGLCFDFSSKSKELIDWANQTTEMFCNAQAPATQTEAAEALNDYREYVVSTKPPQVGQKLDVEELFANIQSQLKVNGRAPYTPDEGCTPDDLNAAFAKLNVAELSHHKKLAEARFAFVEAIQPAAVSEDRLKEFNDAFNHFDQNNNEYLEFDEFSAALKAIGVPILEDEEKAQFGELADEDESGNTWVSRDKFVGFLRNYYENTDTPESVLKSAGQLGNVKSLGASDLQIPPLDEEDRTFLFSQMQAKEDGSYDFEEFVNQQFNVEQ